MFLKVLSVVCLPLFGLMPGVAKDSTGVSDPCACKVVNYTIASASCMCSNPGNPNPVRAFSSSVETFPDGQAEIGQCGKVGCDPESAHPCILKPMRVIVTVAACARDCTGHAATVNDVNWVWDLSNWGVSAPVPLTGTHAIGVALSYTLFPPEDPAYAECDGKENSAELKFKNKDGTTAFFVKFIFGCGKCDNDTGGS